MNNIVYKLDDIQGRLSYEEIKTSCSTNIRKKYHMGQLKLLMSEILFLSKVSQKGDIVVYAGAAPGYHTYKLAKMFPDLKFELWDPRKFDIKERDNITTHQNFFTVDVAHKYAQRKEDILFISDIRDKEFGRVVKEKNIKRKFEIDEQVITTDMKRQMEWTKIIKPKWAYLKFRLPYKSGTTLYFPGKIYLQPYSPVSTETRLMTHDYDHLVEYNHTVNDERMAYFNCYIRFKELEDHRWDKIMDDYGIRKSWDNYIAFYILAHYLEKKNNQVPKDNQIAELFEEIINFLRQKYGQKYDYIYTD